ncbi:FeoB-associated Cys-rich membrane protein [Tenacibaculum xiamenense]|uniref:FeoB-associated Cys-rich membrane protein n=1 Tax=Tenacibaculum xiamenense TaxID=1261553 RepID=UPI0038B42E11
MAYDSINRNGSFSICFSFNIISNFKLMQEVLTYIAVVGALFFLVRKFFWKSKKSKGCDTNCGCG